MGAPQQMMLATASPVNSTYTGTAGLSGSNVGFASGAYGSISPTTFYATSSTILLLLCNGSGNFQFEVNGSQPNSGWTTLTIGSLVLTRASATFSNTTLTLWQWSGVTQPFTNGVAFTAVFA